MIRREDKTDMIVDDQLAFSSRGSFKLRARHPSFTRTSSMESRWLHRTRVLVVYGGV
jgi:hypothetical protein